MRIKEMHRQPHITRVTFLFGIDKSCMGLVQSHGGYPLPIALSCILEENFSTFSCNHGNYHLVTCIGYIIMSWSCIATPHSTREAKMGTGTCNFMVCSAAICRVQANHSVVFCHMGAVTTTSIGNTRFKSTVKPHSCFVCLLMRP